MRDDSVLSTGTNSGAFNNTPPQSQVEKFKQEKEAKRGKLLPSAEIVFEVIEKEKDKIRNIEFFEAESMEIEENFRAELMARRKYMAYLKQLHNHMDNVLRKPEVKNEQAQG